MAAIVLPKLEEPEKVYRWRYRELIAAGYDEIDAEYLAHHSHVDLHRAVELVKSGCPPVLAAEILF